MCNILLCSFDRNITCSRSEKNIYLDMRAKFMFVFVYCLLHPQVKCFDNFSYSFTKPGFIKVLRWFTRMLYAYRRRDKRMDKAIFIGTQQGCDDDKNSYALVQDSVSKLKCLGLESFAWATFPHLFISCQSLVLLFNDTCSCNFSCEQEIFLRVRLEYTLLRTMQ